ncbi:MAG: heparan-alpha-glucosaminide N-acetyltransferase domain-containing protein [Candidatus Izemoplasmatales bacterium]|nr:heparan-alpha-glucosaminide N-acetyltransferase domain-containing protein [Candidatus Izemoplasmatales bacterium]
MINSSGNRILSIDRYRGIAVFLLIVTLPMYFIDAFDFTDGFTTHVIEDAFLLVPNYAFYDLIAPIFIFAAGLSFSLSFKKAVVKYGKHRAFVRSVFRGLKLIAIGSFLLYFGEHPIDDFYRVSSYVIASFCGLWLLLWIMKLDFKRIISTILDIMLIVIGAFALVVGLAETVYLLIHGSLPFEHWNVLQSIGFATLVTLLFHDFKPWMKLIALIILFMIYSFFYQLIGYNGFVSMSHGGVLGSFGWAQMMIAADLIGELSRTNKNVMYLFGAILVATGVAGYLLFDCDKFSVSPGYVSMSIVLSYLLYLIFSLFDFWRIDNGPIVSLGRNPILIYIIHMLAGAYVGIYLNYYAYVYGSNLIAYCGLSLYLVILCALSYFLNRKKIYLKI